MYENADVDHYQASKTRCKTYAEYNYLRPGLASFIKSRHFEVALKLTRQYFHRYNVIDFGCADGVFLPSLAKYFGAVCGIDKNQCFINLAQSLVEQLALNNVKLICNQTLSIEEIRTQISADPNYQVLFLLETLEHIGQKEALYESKVAFIEELL